MVYTSKIIILCFSVLVSLSTRAQTTIGSKLKPNGGSLLDLKEFKDSTDVTATRGLLLPRVKLVDVRPDPGELSASIGGSGTWVELEHIGLMVYNTVNTKTLEYQRGAYPGVYLWNGSQWLGLTSNGPVPPPVDTTDEFVGANSYILAAGGNTVEIEGKRGTSIWNSYQGTDANTGKVLDASVLGSLTSYTAQIVWQEGGDKSTSDVVASVNVIMNSGEPSLVVTSGTNW